MTRVDLDPVVAEAARLVASGEPLWPDGGPAHELALRALAAVDRDVMDDVVDTATRPQAPAGGWAIGPSDYGRCRRQVWYRETPPEGYAPTPVDERRAALGTAIHEAAVRSRGQLYPWRLLEYPVTVPGLDRQGRCDDFDPVTGEVGDIKTAGNRKWDMVGADGPPDKEWGQVLLYGLGLTLAGHTVHSVRINVINRETGEEEVFRRPFDQGAARAALDELVTLATMLDLGMEPARDGTGPGSDWQCRFCPAVSHCWSLPQAEAAGRSPESYTVLGPSPDEAAIVWAGENLLAARARLREAEKAEKEAKALVDGIVGTYGELEFTTTRRPMPDYRGSFERTVQLYGLSEGVRPDVAEVDKPVKRIDVFTSVKRVRASRRKGARSGGQR